MNVKKINTFFFGPYIFSKASKLFFAFIQLFCIFRCYSDDHINLKKIRKFILWLLLIITIVFGVISIILYYNQDRIIKQVIIEANKQLKVPVEVNNFSINWYQDFPNMSIICNGVKIQEAIEGSKASLAELEQLSFSFDLIALIQGSYVFDRVKLKNGIVTIRINEKGERNYLIAKKLINPSEAANKTINFNLNKIAIDQVTINYIDEALQQNYYLYGNSLSAKLEKKQEIYSINLKGDLLSKSINIQQLSYFKQKSLDLDFQFTYNEDNELITFKPSTLSVNKNEFSVKGSIDISSNYINLAIDGINSDIKTLSSLLPNEYEEIILSYKAIGKAEFQSTIVGELSSKNSPYVSISFNIEDGAMEEPINRTKIDSIALKGEFNNGKQHALSTSVLYINNAHARIKDKAVSTTFQLSNFSNPYLKLSTKGSISTEDLFSFLPQKEQFKDLTGLIDFNINLAGKTAHFKKASYAHKIDNSGEIQLTNFGGIYKAYPLPLKDINGRLLFNKNDIAINQLSGAIGASDISMDGFFLNIFPYLLDDKQSLLVEANTKSNFIDLNELLSGLSNEQHSIEKQQASYKLTISPFIQLDLKSNINKMIFQRFEGRHIAANIGVKNQILKANNLETETMGGKINLSGTINTQPFNTIDIHTKATFKHLNVDSIFYTFKDFNQTFLTQKHLKGKIDADVMAVMVLDKSLNFKAEDFEASILASVKEGKLINFEPMQSLSDYVNEDDLANLSFGELKNSIQIKNQTIYLPEMLIKSNVSEISVQGTHTFDQEIEYNFLVPLKNYKRPDKDIAFGAIEETEDYTKLHLKIIGTTDDFDVKWDAKRSLNSVGNQIKEEAKTIKQLFTGKPLKDEKKKQVEVKEDDYFDW